MKTSDVVASVIGPGNGPGIGSLKGDFDEIIGKGNGHSEPKRVTAGLDDMLGNKASVTTRVVAG
jgi:hypothetical protein